MATNKKEAFRQYLEAAGVLDTITKSVYCWTEVCQLLQLLLLHPENLVLCSFGQLVRRS